MNIQASTAAALTVLALGFTGNAWAQATSQMPQAAPPAAESKLSRSDQDFLENAAQAGHTEIQGSKLALEKSGNDQVKKFAQRMIDEHGKVGEELKALASSKSYTLPTDASLVQQAKLKTLDVRDESFDKAYVDQIGVSAHEDAIKLFEEASNEADDPEVKAFASKTLPSLKAHLQEAQSLQKTTQAGK